MHRACLWRLVNNEYLWWKMHWSYFWRHDANLFKTVWEFFFSHQFYLFRCIELVNRDPNNWGSTVLMKCTDMPELTSIILTLADCTGRSENMEFVYFFMLHLVRYKKERSLLKFYSKEFCPQTWHTFESFKIIKKYFRDYIASRRKMLGRR